MCWKWTAIQLMLHSGSLNCYLSVVWVTMQSHFQHFLWCYHFSHKAYLYCGKYSYNIIIIVKVVNKIPVSALCEKLCIFWNKTWYATVVSYTKIIRFGKYYRFSYLINTVYEHSVLREHRKYAIRQLNLEFIFFKFMLKNCTNI